MNQTAPGTLVLTLQCPDAVGIVAATAAFLADRGLTIEESDQFHDHGDGRFHMRTAFVSQAGELAPSLAELEAGFAPIARRFSMEWGFHDLAVRPRIVVAVSRLGHCLADMLHRWKTGWLRADIVAVVSNHDVWRNMAEWHGLPYVRVPTEVAERGEAERAILATMSDHRADLLVLARYMQILTPPTVAALDGRCINIHHSFLPSFKGARPYHQAHARGVKLIGATAHYVTEDLDEGPIIEQGVERVSHRLDPQALVEIGQDLECTTLARAVRWHSERRVLLAGGRTVVFR
jgi:formyltetrahydrofolate deformylase